MSKTKKQKRRSVMPFRDRVQIGIEYMSYIKLNEIEIPSTLRARKLMFIRWYMERYGYKPFIVLFTELANDVLYIKEVTLERLIFNEK